MVRRIVVSVILLFLVFSFAVYGLGGDETVFGDTVTQYVTVDSSDQGIFRLFSSSNSKYVYQNLFYPWYLILAFETSVAPNSAQDMDVFYKYVSDNTSSRNFSLHYYAPFSSWGVPFNVTGFEVVYYNAQQDTASDITSDYTMTDLGNESTTYFPYFREIYLFTPNDPNLPRFHPNDTINFTIHYLIPPTAGGTYPLSISWDFQYVPLAELPDLTPGDISFSPEHPKEEGIVTINAIVHNIGETKAENAVVRFFDGNPTNGIQIGADQTIAEIPVNESATVQMDWTAYFGEHDIYMLVDPDNTIEEKNESNNNASNTIVVATHKVLVVATYYQDETIDDIRRHESGFREKLQDTHEYYLEQSYGEDYVWFSEPVYVQMPHSSLWYLKIPTFPPDYFVPNAGYANNVCDLVAEGGYHAILAYQTDKGVETGHKKGFRAVTYLPPFPPITKPVSCVSISNGYGTFAHELGHALYDFDDFYGDWTQGNRGDIGRWGLMGAGDLEKPPAPIISVNKVKAQWLTYATPVRAPNLIEPKIFTLTALKDMQYQSEVIKIGGISGAGISLTTYDFILEAREDTPSTREPGVVVYEDQHVLPWSYLENLPPQNSPFMGSDDIPTLFIEEELDEHYTTYLHAPTGLRFEYLNDTTPNLGVYESQIKVGFNLSGVTNLTGVLLNNLNVNSSVPNSTSGLSAPPPCARPATVTGFSKIIRPVEDSIVVMSDGKFKIEINVADENVRVNSIKIVNSVNQTECMIDFILPTNVNAGESVTIIGGDCGLPDNKSTYNVQLYVNISYDTFSQDGTPIKHIDRGVLRFIPACMQEKQTGGLKLVLIIFAIFGIPLILIVLTCLLLIKYRKNRKTVKRIILWLITFIVLLLALILLYQIGHFASAATIGLVEGTKLPSFAPVNLTYPDIDLHAYTTDGLHTGVNYGTGLYENQIPGAVSSGDMIAEEWIFVPNNLDVYFVVDGHDVQQYLDETNSSEVLTINYSLQVMEYGRNPGVEVTDGNVIITDRTVSPPVIGAINPGEQNTVMLEWIDPDDDNDGIPDENDRCPLVAGCVEYNGCPERLYWLLPLSLGEFTIQPGSTLPIKFNVTSCEGYFVEDTTVLVDVFNRDDASVSKTFTHGTGDENVRVNAIEGSYITNFHTKDFPEGNYTIDVTLSNIRAGMSVEILKLSSETKGNAIGKKESKFVA